MMRALLPTTLCCLLVACAGEAAPHDPPFGHSGAELRPDDPTVAPPRFDANEMVESVVSPSGAFRIHFSRSGANAVRALDANQDNVPDDVEEVAKTYDEVLAYYRDTLGFRAPLSDEIVTSNNGGDKQFDVYLVDFAGRADGEYRSEKCLPSGACAGYMLQENDFNGYSYASFKQGTRILASHEFFHAVQAGYRGSAGVLVNEGSAVWATEQFDPTLPDFESFIGAYLERPDRSLAIDPSGPVPSFAYGSALFFEFLSEHLDNDVIRLMWEQMAKDPSTTWVAALDAVLHDSYSTSLDAVFSVFAEWNVHTSRRAKAGEFYAHGSSYPAVDTTLMELPAKFPDSRIAPMSARYYVAPLDQGASFKVVSDAPEGSLAVLPFVVTSNVVEALPKAALGTVIDVEGKAGAKLWIVLVHPRFDLEGAKATLCVAANGSDDCQEPANTPDLQPPATTQEAGCSNLGMTQGWEMLLGWAMVAAHHWMRRQRQP